MKKLIIAFAALVGLAEVPAYAQDFSAWDQALKQAVAACQAGAPKAKGYMVWHANCLNTAVETYMIPRGHDTDLWRQFNAFRSVIAARADRGEITVEEEELLLTQKRSELVSLSLQRFNAQAAANAQQQQVRDNLILGWWNANRPGPRTVCNTSPMGGATLPGQIICQQY